MPKMPEFTKVNSLETSTAVYTVGKTIKFWDIGERAWFKGKIVAITQCQGYFVSVTILQQNYNKKREINIHREDWVDTKAE
ncbi:hypothetical protein NIES2111_61380 (plasmid) [Nostoc sp. NIES-2111]|nr:hypothetical protein NIES2111_61380 [Nostoc sp. NIES-2111]